MTTYHCLATLEMQSGTGQSWLMHVDVRLVETHTVASRVHMGCATDTRIRVQMRNRCMLSMVWLVHRSKSSLKIHIRSLHSCSTFLWDL